MYHTLPFVSLSIVVLRVILSTVPEARPTSTESPTPYWSSTSMNIPDKKSLTIDWAPNPTATPTIPAPAISGPRFIPISPSEMSTATVQITKLAILERTEVKVSVLAFVLSSDCSPWRTLLARTLSVILSIPLIFCNCASARFSLSAVRRSPKWTIALLTILEPTKATRRTIRIVNGLSTAHPIIDESVAFPEAS